MGPTAIEPTTRPSSAAPATTEGELVVLLQRLQRQWAAGDRRGQQTTLQAIGRRRLALPQTVTGALCLGGMDLAALLVGHGRKPMNEPERQLAVVNAFRSLVDAQRDAADAETQVAERLIEVFGLDTSATELLDHLWSEIFIVAGAPGDVIKAAETAMRQQRWALALRGCTRLRQALNDGTPRLVHAMAATCLHRLGRYAEAEAWARQGLGEQRALLETGPVHTQEALLQRWAGQDTPLVSIVCMAYNHERYIESALRGFLSQDCSFRFEILVHDDASTDGTQAIIRRWQARYPQIIRAVLQTENQLSRGVRGLELLLAQARGAYVATCEGDDFWIDPAKLQRQVAFLEAHPEFSCSAHNYHLYREATLTVEPWVPNTVDHVLSPRQLMGLVRLLWVPTLVFRKTFTKLPPERELAPLGDQFLTSYLGTFGPCMYFESLFGAVRRENAFSVWTPLPEIDKEHMRIKVWIALARLHSKLGNAQAVDDLLAKISASPLDDTRKAAVIDAAMALPLQTLEAA